MFLKLNYFLKLMNVWHKLAKLYTQARRARGMNYPGEKLKKITEAMQRAVIQIPVADDRKGKIEQLKGK